MPLVIALVPHNTECACAIYLVIVEAHFVCHVVQYVKRKCLLSITSLILHRGNEGNCLHAPWSFIAAVPWKCSSRNVQFPHRELFITQRENALVLLPFQKRSIEACN